MTAVGIPEIEGAPEEAYRKLLHAIHLIMVLDRDGRIVFVNQFAASFFGYTQDEMHGSDPMSFLIEDEESETAFDSLIRDAREKKAEIVWREFACLRKNRDAAWTSWIATPVGTAGEILCVGYNRTGGRRAEEAVAQSEERFRIAAESAGDFIYDIDLKTGAVQWFGPIDEYLGYEPGAIPRSIDGWRSLVNPDDLPSINAAFQRHRITREPFSIRYRVVDKWGNLRWWEDRGRILFDRDGMPDRFIGVNIDITRKIEADEAIRRHLRHLKFTNRILALSSGIDPPETVIPAVIGALIEEIPSTAGGIILQPARGRDPFVWASGIGADDLRQLARSKAESNPLMTIDTIDAGEGRSGLLILRKVSDQPFSPDEREMIAIASQLIGTYLERSYLREELALAYEDLSLFVDIMSHDINNSNAIAMGYTEILRDGDEGSAEGYITRIIDCLVKNAEIIRDVSTLRNLRSRRDRLTRTPLDPVIRREIRHREGVPIEYEGTDVVVLADDLISEIFTNLIGNAIRHGGPGTTISITVSENGDEVVISVADTGSGIPDDLKARVLDRHRKGKSRTSGSGLGLFIVHKLVQRYGGSILIADRVAGHPGEGALFIITLRGVGVSA
nr:PAS domain-containing protein [Methanocalculus chunghsingensis]